LSRWFSISAAAAGIVAAAFALLGGWPELRKQATGARYNVILLSVESFRADAVTPNLTPRLLNAVKMGDGVLFRNHRAVSAWTGPNIIALLSGTHPIRQGVHSRGHSLQVSPDNDLPRSDQHGFKMKSLQPFALIDTFAGLGLIRDPGIALDKALADLRQAKTRRGFWYHYLETHLPHAPHLADGTRLQPGAKDFDRRLGVHTARSDAELKKRVAVATQPVVPVGQFRFTGSDRPWVRSYYDSNIALFDRWFDQFFNTFEKTGLAKNTVLIVTADHGEELAERGRVGHASTTREASLTREILTLPLIIWTPDLKMRAALRAWADSSMITDHTDIGMSLLRLASTPKIPGAKQRNNVPQGRDLTAPPAERATLAFTSAAGYAEPKPETTAYFLASIETRFAKLVARLRPDGKILNWEKTVTTPQIPRAKSHEKALRNALKSALASLTFPAKPGMPANPNQGSAKLAWIWPQAPGIVTHKDLAGRSTLQWRGDSAKRYIVEYEVGDGAMAMAGKIEVEGPAYKFGHIDQDYWKTFVIPYRTLRLRVKEKNGAPASEWLSFKLQ
jgi:choline-sulfatase